MGINVNGHGVTYPNAMTSSYPRTWQRAWIPRLKALSNGIVPHQAYAVAACILEAEGLSTPA